MSEKVEVEFGIHAIEAITENERIEVLERNVINIDNKESLPVYVHKGTFFAVVPYVLEGWKNSLDLSKEDKKNIFKEMSEWNLRLLNVYKTSNLELYNKVYKEREYEFDKSNFIQPVPNSSDFFHSKFKDLIAVPDDLYRVEFFCK